MKALPWILSALLLASALTAQPRQMWQKSGALTRAMRVAVEPNSGVIAVAAAVEYGGEDRSTFSIRYPSGEVITRQLPCSEPTLMFINDETLLLFSHELVTEFNIVTREITRQDELSLEKYLGWFYVGLPNFIFSANGQEVLIDATVGAGKKEHLIVRVNTRTLEELDRFAIGEWDRNVTFHSPTTNYLFYDHNEIFVDSLQSISLPQRHRIEHVAVLHDTCWVMHFDSTRQSLWVSRVRLDQPKIVEQRLIMNSVYPVHTRDLQVRQGLLVFGFDRELYVLDPVTLDTRGVLHDAASLQASYVDADGGYYRTRSGYLIRYNISGEPVDTLGQGALSFYSFAQDRTGRLFGAQGALVEIDPLTGESHRVAAGPLTSTTDFSTDLVLADATSDRFAMMKDLAIHIFAGPDRDSLVLRLDYGNTPDSTYFVFEPLWAPIFVEGTTDVIIASRCYVSHHFTLIERLTPTADTVAPLRSTIRRIDDVVGKRCLANADATRIVFSVASSDSSLFVVGNVTTELIGATRAVYHPFSSSFVTDHPSGARLFRDDLRSPSPPIHLDERLIPLCGWKNGPFMLGWLDSTSRIALYNVETSTVIWRHTASSRPTAAHIDEGGKWFVVSYEMGVTEGFALDSMTMQRGDQPAPVVTVGPNPSTDVIELRIADVRLSIDSWQIFDRTGLMVHSGPGTSISISSLPSGTYHAVVNTGTQRVGVAFVVVR